MLCSGCNVSTSEHVIVDVQEGWIRAVDPILDPRDLAASRHSGIYLAPGFIDLQVNGFAGVDYNSPAAPHDEILRSIQVMFATGVTRFLPTVITGAPEDMRAALANLARARARNGPFLAMEGFHVEGPHISPEDGPRGAHPQHWVRPPDIQEFRRWQEATGGLVKLVTVAPEWPGAVRYIETLSGEGVTVAIGHTRASAAEIHDAVSAGATLSTHLGNGADPVLPRSANYILEQLAEDRLAASLIVDGHHLSPAFLRIALRTKSASRCVLVTDAVMPATCRPGNYMLGEVQVELRPDQRVVLRGGTRLAGSSLRMDVALSNVLATRDVSLVEAIAMATSNPARIGRIGGRLRGINPGERADLVQFRMEKGALQVASTYLAGELVYQAAEN